MEDQVVRPTRRRRAHAEEFKQELVARSLQPGVSVAAIAMDHGINANLLFGWRRKHLNNVKSPEPSARRAAAVLLPVSIEASPREGLGTSSLPVSPTSPAPRPGSGSIEIEIGTARVRLRGVIDEASLRTVLTALRSLA